MHKKIVLSKILRKILPYRNLAKWFLLLVEESDDQNVIDNLYTTIIFQIKSIKWKKEKEILTTALQELREKEYKNQEQVNREADEIFDDLLKNME